MSTYQRKCFFGLAVTFLVTAMIFFYGISAVSASVLILDGTMEFTVPAGENATVYGTTGNDRIRLESGAHAILKNFPGSNTVTMNAPSSRFNVSRSGGAVIFSGSEGTFLNIPATLSTQYIAFTDTVLSLSISPFLNQVMLGDQVVSQTPTAIGGSSSTSEPGEFVPERSVSVTTSTVDDTGGAIEITGTGTELDGSRISFPEGALPESTEISVGYSTGSIQLPGSSVPQTMRTLNLDTSGSDHFSQLVEITVPYADESDMPPVPFYVDAENRLRPVLVKSIDRDARTITFVTAHASSWTTIDLSVNLPDEDTNFRPADDGFQIVNYGSLINSGGECFGMVTFAQWYYDKKMERYGELYPRYMNSVGTDTHGNSLTGQDVIATRAHSAATQAWTWSNYIAPNFNTDDEYRYNAIITALMLTKRPVVLDVWRFEGEGETIDNIAGGHAVLAFGADKNDGLLFIYDPNHPGVTSQIRYNPETKKFDDYGRYTKIFLAGIGTYDLRESFENIFEDAEHNFTTSNMPQITITSHENGQEITTRNIELEGRIESSEVLIKTLDIMVGNDKFSTSVSNDGRFSVGISLNKVGNQHLRFIARDRNGDEVTPNNMDAEPFILNMAMETSVILVTLNWDKDDTDVDLYVIDPTGDYSCYYHKPTSDGGELDHDIITGYGPEHWTLSSTDTIRYDQEYRVRVHYYSDHGNGGTNYRLTVKLYEGTDREVEYVKTGYLLNDSPGNNSPTAEGADWQDFTFPIVLTRPDSSNGLRSSQGDRNLLQAAPVKVQVAVPPESVRRALKAEAAAR